MIPEPKQSSSRSGAIRWYGENTGAAFEAVVNAPGAPSTKTGEAGSPRFGTSLDFDPVDSQHIAFVDGDSATNGSYLVAVAAELDTTELAEGESQVLVGKANAGAFSLELHHAAGEPSTLLRFGVYVGTAYSYASMPATDLSAGALYLIVGAYDGDGSVRLWVDGSAATPSAALTGPVVDNDVPILAGADPQDGPPRYFFDGKLQTVVVQRWPPQ